MKSITWTNEKITKLITSAMDNPNAEEVNKALAIEFGGTAGAIATARVSISRCLQGFEPSSKKGDKKGYSFGQNFTSTVNDWCNESYEGGLSRNALSHKF